MGIELHIRDIKLLYKIKSFLNRGTVIIRKDKEGNPIKRIYRIRNKEQLKTIILPILINIQCYLQNKMISYDYKIIYYQVHFTELILNLIFDQKKLFL
jgi:ubiquinol-cytochrome c reductase cytochrome b subunit